MRRFRLSTTLGKIVVTVVGLTIVFMLLYPVLYVIFSSIVVGQSIITSWSDIVRRGFSLSHYFAAISDPKFISASLTSILVAVLNIAISVAVITPAAYAFSRFEFRGKNTLLLTYLVLSQAGTGFGVAAVIALYVFLLKLNMMGIPMIGNPFVLPAIYTATAVPFQTWLVKSYFDSMPRSLDEAAFIDGANWSTIIFKVILPASKPAMIIITLFAFMGAWGEFITASFLRVNTLAAYIYQTAVGQTIYWGDFAAKTLLFAIPVAIVYAFSQKYIGEAMRYGAGKM